jgi:hypothetical protein
MTTKKLSENRTIIIVGFIASVIGIVAFVTGNQTLQSFLPSRVPPQIVSGNNFAYSTDLSSWGVNYYVPQSIDLSEDIPSRRWSDPLILVGNSPLYGVIKFSENTKVNVILHTLNEVESALVFDFDNNSEFTDSEPYLTTNGSISNLIEFQISYPDGSIEPYSIRVYFPIDFNREIGANRLHYYRASYRKGTLNFGSGKYTVLLLDENTDGKYSDLWNTEILIDFNKDGVIGENEKQVAMTPININQVYYTVSEIADSGKNIKLARSRFGQVVGLVVDSQTNEPIQDAVVTITPINLSAKTGLDGGYSIEVPEGYQSQITVLAPHYSPVYVQPTEAISAGKSLRIDFALIRSPDLGSNVIRLYNGDSYHFLTGERDYLEGGDFFFGFSDDMGKFLANNKYQQGIIDLGNVGETPLSQIQPPTSGYYQFGVEALVGHTYVSPAKQGEVGHYIIFRVRKIENNQYVEIEFLYK